MMLLGRLPSFSAKVFGNYASKWRCMGYLGGYDKKWKMANGWKAAATKTSGQLCQIIAEPHLEHAADGRFPPQQL
jgi:hypothetical protein